MKLGRFLRRVNLPSLDAEERTWLPKWLAGQAKLHRIQAEDEFPAESGVKQVTILAAQK